jgi:signal recognition particle GTPase
LEFSQQFGVLVYFIGTGEGEGDLVAFEVGKYIYGLMGE